jgi:hypothetical protein
MPLFLFFIFYLLLVILLITNKFSVNLILKLMQCFINIEFYSLNIERQADYLLIILYHLFVSLKPILLTEVQKNQTIDKLSI